MRYTDNMKINAKLLKIILLLSLLPASASAVTITIFDESIDGDAGSIHPGATTVGLTDGSNIIVGSLGYDYDYFRVPVDGSSATITDMMLTFEGNGSSGVREVFVSFYDSEGKVGSSTPPNFFVPFSDQSLFSGSFGPSTPGFSEWANNQTEFLFEIVPAYATGAGANNNYSLQIDATVVQYSSVPDTGSTAALLGAGVFVLAAARRRLG